MPFKTLTAKHLLSEAMDYHHDLNLQEVQQCFHKVNALMSPIGIWLWIFCHIPVFQVTFKMVLKCLGVGDLSAHIMRKSLQSGTQSASAMVRK